MMQQHMAGYAGTSITTELIQKYLDENKQLILAILDNQNLGKLNECATYQSKLQQNLMYLAAIADAQPQAGQSTAQVPPVQAMQPSQQYLQQQQMMMNHRNTAAPSPQYMQQQNHQQHRSQQDYHHNHQGMASQHGNSGLHMMNSHGSNNHHHAIGGNGNTASGDISDRDGNHHTNMSMRSDGPVARDGNGVAGGEQDSEASYLKSSD